MTRLALVAGLLGLAAACGSSRSWCDVDALLDDEAAPTATDCGTAPLDDDADVTACLVEAFRAGVPFRGITQQSGPGGTLVVRAWAGDDAGVRVLLGSFDLCSDHGCSGSVVRSTCDAPSVEDVDGRERLVCGGASACGEVLCGTPEADCSD